MLIFSLTKIVLSLILLSLVFKFKQETPCAAECLLEKNMINSGLMTIEDLADYLKVTRRTIYDWVKHNKIPAVKLVGQWRFKKDKIDAWLENQSLPH